MQDLIKEGFQGMTGPYADATRALIEHGNYDLVGHFDNETIMPSLWDSVLEPGMTVRMVLYQFPPEAQIPRQQPFFDTQISCPPYQYYQQIFERPPIPSSKYQEQYSEDKESRHSHDNDTKGQKDTHDDGTTPTVSTGTARRVKTSSNVKASVST